MLATENYARVRGVHPSMLVQEVGGAETLELATL